MHFRGHNSAIASAPTYFYTSILEQIIINRPLEIKHSYEGYPVYDKDEAPKFFTNRGVQSVIFTPAEVSVYY